MGKKSRSSVQKARRTSIGTSTLNPFTKIRGSAVFHLKTPSRAVATNKSSAKTRNSVITICQSVPCQPQTHTASDWSIMKRRTAMPPEKPLGSQSTQQSGTGSYTTGRSRGEMLNTSTLCHPTNLSISIRFVRMDTLRPPWRS